VEGATARSLASRIVVLALVAVALLLVYRVGRLAYEIVDARASTPAASPVRAAQNGSRLVVFTTAGCGACRMAKAWMDKRGVVYEERRVDNDEGSRAELASLGKGVVVPTFVVDEQVLTGFDVQGIRLSQALEAHGIR
jgi:glutaredoxin 3